MYINLQFYFSPIQEKDMLTYHKSSQEEPSNSTEGLILESAEDGWNTVTSKKNKKKTGGGKSSQSNDDKENVIHTQSEVRYPLLACYPHSE